MIRFAWELSLSPEFSTPSALLCAPHWLQGVSTWFAPFGAGSGEHLEHLDPPPAPLRNADEPPPPPPGAMQDVRWQHHMAGMQQGQQPLPWDDAPGQQAEPAAPPDPESGEHHCQRGRMSQAAHKHFARGTRQGRIWQGLRCVVGALNQRDAARKGSAACLSITRLC